MKYEFTGKVKVFRGITLKQIRALVSFSTIEKGEIGGWIEGEKNLSQVSGNAWVYGNARVYGDASIAFLGSPDQWGACAYLVKGGFRIQVGCRLFTLTEGREYWKGKEDRKEVLAALDYAEQIAKIRGWIK